MRISLPRILHLLPPVLCRLAVLWVDANLDNHTLWPYRGSAEQFELSVYHPLLRALEMDTGTWTFGNRLVVVGVKVVRIQPKRPSKSKYMR